VKGNRSPPIAGASRPYLSYLCLAKMHRAAAVEKKKKERGKGESIIILLGIDLVDCETLAPQPVVIFCIEGERKKEGERGRRGKKRIERANRCGSARPLRLSRSKKNFPSGEGLSRRGKIEKRATGRKGSGFPLAAHCASRRAPARSCPGGGTCWKKKEKEEKKRGKEERTHHLGRSDHSIP